MKRMLNLAAALFFTCALHAADQKKPGDKGDQRKQDAPAVIDPDKPEVGPEDIHKPRPRTGPQNPPTPPKAGEPINDKAVFRHLEIEGGKLVDAHRTLSHWKPQLNRKTCQLKLPSAAGRKLTTVEIARRAEASVVIVGTFYNCGKCSNTHMATASGFFLTESGALATCRHVLAANNDNGLGVVVLTRDGQLCPVREVLAADTANDLLIMQVEGRGFKALPLTDDAPPGAPVTLVSHPENCFYTLSTGVVARRSVTKKRNEAIEFISITADFAKGSSGAPVCNENGAVLGLVNNTHSIYYNEERGRQENLQMVVKNCTPATALMNMIKPR